MSDITVTKVGDLDSLQGPNAIPGIKFLQAGRELGVTGLGMNILELEPDCSAYPEHDHAGDGQEEVYVVLDGGGTLVAGLRQWPLVAGTLIRVPHDTKRKLVPGADGLTVLALGATPGKAYEPRS
jgi:mannose-6-phosphate isomerase-like protein (cupin superfamily)